MLICPQCQFENPPKNRFCQSCGTSLVDKPCNTCGVSIPIEASACNICGANNQIILKAIVTQTETKEVELTSAGIIAGAKIKGVEVENLSDLFSVEPPEISDSLSVSENENYLNSQKRYYILESINAQNLDISSIDSSYEQYRVVDRKPLQKTAFSNLRQQQQDLFSTLETNKSYLDNEYYWNLIGIPIYALPYLILERYTPVIPELYDAWQQEDRGAVVISDRSSWQSQIDLWSQSDIPLLQVLWSIDEMAKLWIPLSSIGCGSSLAIASNLRVDEDGSFCLQQIYIDAAETAYSLSKLAMNWQLWLSQSERDNYEPVVRLLDNVISGQIEDIEVFRAQLHRLSPESYLDSQLDRIDKTTASHEEELELFEDHEDLIDANDLEERETTILAMQLSNIVHASATDIGSTRNHNEDFFGVKTTRIEQANSGEQSLHVRGLYIVCDGMGGHEAGEVASAMAVDSLQKYFYQYWLNDLPDKDAIEAGILQANQKLYQTNLGNSRSGSGRMGTTLVMALLQDTKLAIAHVGDSRIYRVTRKRGLEKLTQDHEVGQREINRGIEPEIAYGRPDAYQLTQALGPRDNNFVRPDIEFIEVEEDCLLLLCSDGLSDNDLLEEHYQTYLTPLISSSANIEEGLSELMTFANSHNGHDNITAILLRIKLKPEL
jgi:protein phosphatase